VEASEELGNAPELVETVPEVGKSTKAKQNKEMGQRRGGCETAAEGTSVAHLVEGLPGVAGHSADIPEKDEVSDEVMFEARCILRQRQRKGAKRQFFVKWADESSTDSWCNEDDVSDALLAHWFITHNPKGLKQKRLNLAKIGMLGPWACRRWWEERSPPRVKRVDQYGNEL